GAGHPAAECGRAGADPGPGRGPARAVARADHDGCRAQATAALPRPGRDVDEAGRRDRAGHPLADASQHARGGAAAAGRGRRAPAAVVERVRALATRHSDGQIAARLNADGLTSGTGRPFTAARVQWIRYVQAIASGCPEHPGRAVKGQRGDGRYSTRAAAGLLDVDIATGMAWWKAGGLDGIQAKPHGPWWVRLTPEIIAELRKPVRRRWKKRSSR